MTPEFALDLSHDGISLLRRAEDGWRQVGAVSLDADSLVEDLAALRAQVEGEVAAKLVIPNSQILYSSCPASGKDELADEVRVRAALVGATPYEVSDLVFDWESDGETLQIAVVARETLEEARAFAAEHGFGPVGYVAVPPRGAFLREPFFGPAERGPGAGPAMLAEAEPIEVVGAWEAQKVAEPEPEVEAAPVEVSVALEAALDEADAGVPGEEAAAIEVADEADAGADYAPLVAAEEGAEEEAAVEAVAPGEAEEAAVDAPVEAAEEGVPDVAAPDEIEAAGAAEATVDAAVEDEAAAPDAEETAPEVVAAREAPEIEAQGADLEGPVSGAAVAAADAPVEEDSEEAGAAVAMPAFSSIRTQASEGRAPRLGAAVDGPGAGPRPRLGGATRDDTPASPPEKTPSLGRSSGEAAKGAAPKEAAKAETVAPAPSAASVEAAPDEAPKVAAAQIAREVAASTPAADPELAPQDASPRSKAAFAAFRSKVGGLRRTEKSADTLTPEIIAAPLPRPTPDDLPERLSQEPKDGDFTLFGARGKEKAKPSKGFPIGLTVALLLLLGAAGLWSKIFLASDQSTAQDGPVVAEQSLASAAPLLGADGALTRSITFSETGTSGATIAPGGEAELAEALSAPAQPDPATEGAPVVASLADDPFSSLPEEEPRLAEPMFENPPLPEFDADADPGADELADSEPEPEAAPGEPLTPEAAQAAYAESGVWQQAPEPGRLPAEDNTDDIYIASIDPEVQPYDAVALPQAQTGSGSDAALPRQASPMPPGQDVEFAEDGSIRPTEEGVVTADGVTLYAGRPHVVPRVRPGGAATAEAETAAADVPAAEDTAAEADALLAGKRPKARPEGIVEENEKAELGGRTRAELAGLRPKERPQSLQDEAEASRQAAIEEAVRSSEAENAELAEDETRADAEAEARAEAELKSASKYAVASSRKPASRPRGFDDKVASARRKAEEEAEAQARAAAAAAARATSQPEAESREEEVQTASAAVVLPRNQKVAPAVPSSASVAKAATNRNALKLRDINLIGVFGSPNQRRALVRLPSGRLLKVKPGDRLDGGKVAAIGQNQLRYVKRGKNITLSMPSG
ncbi:hypothetical protein [Oceanicola sp. 502str15]|uniref:hypothetical protein n=1 Tax=Oceanicola sp. 502str15 TaxID=2696061 RepID=UPI0020944A39|nr:hypothetical protein [Oceanicola sp. 502str15]MCO6382932.1 hypothetical protein [Oceanicola sp. 502str15]